MRPQSIKELGLSPLWRLRGGDNAAKTAAAAKTPAAAVVNNPPAKSAAAAPPLPQTPTPPAAAAPKIPPAERERIIRDMDWIPLEKAVQECDQCDLCKARRKPAFGVGDRRASLMLVGEGPGAEEDRQGVPFVGEAGKLLDAMLAAIQLRRGRDVYIANIVKCRPPGNRNPTAAEALACLPYLRRQIALVRPRLLVALGRVASAFLLNSDEPISALRQKLRDHNGVPVVVTYHPAYLLRNPLDKRKSWDDLRMIRSLLRDPP